MKKSLTDNEVAIEIGQRFANTMFKDMLNLNFQGPNFDWNNFPKMFAGICAASLFTAYPKVPKNIKDLETVAMESFNKEGERLKVEYQKTDTLPVNS